ncbi:MAG: hypothetical protein K0V04_02740, partial [Deltaproteobacteria bacterium]|nr:hypothetical protein [Deltaproteobacteria bacterium]
MDAAITPTMPPSIRLTAAQRQALDQRHRQRLRECEPWSAAMKWKPELNIQGATYKVLELWPGMPATDLPVDALQPGQFVDSPSRRFRYCVRLHRRGQTLLTWW